MESIIYSKEELEKLEESLEKFDIESDAVEARRVLIDFSKPSRANQWVKDLRELSAEPRPAGIIGVLKYYKMRQGEPTLYTYEFLLSSKNNQAATTERLNFECRTPTLSSKGVQTFESISYFNIVKRLKDEPDQICNFVTNTLRLIKGTSSNKDSGKLLLGSQKVTDCALDFVAILLTAECLRDPRCKYLVISEFYKLKKGKIDIDDLFHPLFARYIPARTTKADFLKNSVRNWPKKPVNGSRIPSSDFLGGAQQMREVSKKQILSQFYDEEMQSYFLSKFYPSIKDEKRLRKLINQIEKEREKLQNEYNEECAKVIKKAFEMLEADIIKIQGNTAYTAAKKKAEIESIKADYSLSIERIQAKYDFEANKANDYYRESEYKDAKKKLEELENPSFEPFFEWVQKKFTKAYKYCNATD